MNVRAFLPAVLFLGATVGLVYFGWIHEREVPLIDVVEGPRPPVVADATTRPIVLRGLEERFRTQGNALREERNAIAREHAEAVEDWRQGRRPLREVENLEQLLWVARKAVGEIDARTMHANLAELFAREAQRRELLQADGMASEDDVLRAWLYVARERVRAGQPEPDAQGRDYAAQRTAYLDGWRRRNELLLESGIGTREYLEIEWKALQEDFPPVP